MSKLLGKLFCEADTYQTNVFEDKSFSCYIKYVKSKDAFAFNIRKSEVVLLSFKISASILECVVEADSSDNEWLYKFSQGYKTKVKKDVYELRQLRSDELDWIARRLVEEDFKPGEGRKMLILNDILSDDYSFDMCCVFLYLFNISHTVLNEAKRQWKRDRWGRTANSWLYVSHRKKGKGRVRGALGKKEKFALGALEETDSEFNERIAHNKKVAIMKGYLGWYLDACREECKRRGVRFDKKLWTSVWNVERTNIDK